MEASIAMAHDRLFLKSIKVEKHYDEECLVTADPARLKIAFLNIIHNAIEAMEEGFGVLELSIKGKDEGVVLVIQDNGSGMTEEQLSKMFDIYYTSKPSGLGVGLANVRTILQEHNANVNVTSEPGEGTTFQIFFYKAKCR